MPKTIGYMRVSTREQNLCLQEDALKKAGVDYIYSDKMSGVRDDRPDFARMMSDVECGDTIIVWKIDRLARSLVTLLKVMEELKARGIQIKSLQEPFIDTTTATGDLIWKLIAVLAEFERKLLIERTIAGLEAARALNRCGGRPKKMQNEKLIAKILELHSKGTDIKTLCMLYKISRSTLYRYINKASESKVERGVGEIND